MGLDVTVKYLNNSYENQNFCKFSNEKYTNANEQLDHTLNI